MSHVHHTANRARTQPVPCCSCRRATDQPGLIKTFRHWSREEDSGYGTDDMRPMTHGNGTGTGADTGPDTPRRHTARTRHTGADTGPAGQAHHTGTGLTYRHVAQTQAVAPHRHEPVCWVIDRTSDLWKMFWELRLQCNVGFQRFLEIFECLAA